MQIMQIPNVFAVVASVTQVVEVRRQVATTSQAAPVTTDCPSLYSSLLAQIPMPTPIASIESAASKDICKMTELTNYMSEYSDYQTRLDEFGSAASNQPAITSFGVKCYEWIGSSASSELSRQATASCLTDVYDNDSVTGSSPATSKPTAATTTGTSNGAATGAAAATTTAAPGAGSRAGMSMILAVGAVFAAGVMAL